MTGFKLQRSVAFGALLLLPLIMGARACSSEKDIYLGKGPGPAGSTQEDASEGTAGAGGAVGEKDAGAVKDAGKGTAGSGSDGGVPATDAGHAPVVCGSAVCKSGEVCCNESCGICTPPGGFCTQQFCGSGSITNPCSKTECGNAPMMPNIVCPDGSTAGPVCERNADGKCSWVLKYCSTISSDPCDGACTKGQYCEAANCGRNGEKGVCTAIPAPCVTLAYEPQCGCDGVTYGSACMAHAAGVAVDYKGECSGACRLANATAVYDVSGVCVILSCDAGYADCDANPNDGCETNLNSIYNCGACGKMCNGTACVKGACSAQQLNCGGIAGLQCSAGQYCDYAAGDGCDVADGMGLCTDQPQVCTMMYAPVCGCDNKTYGNACGAASAGVSVKYTGVCGITGCTFGMDQTCNDNPMISSIHGVCNKDGTCTCNSGYSLNPATGKCL